MDSSGITESRFFQSRFKASSDHRVHTQALLASVMSSILPNMSLRSSPISRMAGVVFASTSTGVDMFEYVVAEAERRDGTLIKSTDGSHLSGAEV